MSRSTNPTDAPERQEPKSARETKAPDARPMNDKKQERTGQTQERTGQKQEKTGQTQEKTGQTQERTGQTKRAQEK